MHKLGICCAAALSFFVTSVAWGAAPAAQQKKECTLNWVQGTGFLLAFDDQGGVMDDARRIALSITLTANGQSQMIARIIKWKGVYEPPKEKQTQVDWNVKSFNIITKAEFDKLLAGGKPAEMANEKPVPQTDKPFFAE